jgi:chromosome segregation ATPase
VLEEQCATLQQQAASAGPGATEALAALKADLGNAMEREAQALHRCEGLERDGAEAQSRLRKAKEEGTMLRGEWDRACEQARVLQQDKTALATQLDEALQQVQALTDALTEAEDMTLSGGNAANALDQEQIAELGAQCEALQAEDRPALKPCRQAS